MLIAYGTWELWFRLFGGTSKPDSSFFYSSCAAANTIVHSFLVKDAQQEIAGERLKA